MVTGKQLKDPLQTCETLYNICGFPLKITFLYLVKKKELLNSGTASFRGKEEQHRKQRGVIESV